MPSASDSVLSPSPRIVVLSPDTYKKVPWRNGQGVTTELIRYPESDPQARTETRFLWRASIADITQASPFSSFSGYERLIAVIEGQGMALSIDGGNEVECRPHSPALRFSGEATVACRLLQGPIRDFNLIFDAESLSGAVMRVTEGSFLTIEGGSVLVHALSGTLSVKTADGQSFSVTPRHTAILSNTRVEILADGVSRGICATVSRKQ